MSQDPYSGFPDRKLSIQSSICTTWMMPVKNSLDEQNKMSQVPKGNLETESILFYPSFL